MKVALKWQRYEELHPQDLITNCWSAAVHISDDHCTGDLLLHCVYFRTDHFNAIKSLGSDVNSETTFLWSCGFLELCTSPPCVSNCNQSQQTKQQVDVDLSGSFRCSVEVRNNCAAEIFSAPPPKNLKSRSLIFKNIYTFLILCYNSSTLRKSTLKTHRTHDFADQVFQCSQ